MVCVAARQAPPVAPAVTATAPASVTPMVPPPAPVPATPTSASIWVVDDDAALRSVVKQMLAEDDHTLWDTGDPTEAIRHFAEVSPAERPDLILADVIMPAMTGMRMIEQISAISPDIRVLYMSGYVQSIIEWQEPPVAVAAFLEKPLSPDVLLATVQRLLRAAPA